MDFQACYAEDHYNQAHRPRSLRVEASDGWGTVPQQDVVYFGGSAIVQQGFSSAGGGVAYFDNRERLGDDPLEQWILSNSPKTYSEWLDGFGPDGYQAAAAVQSTSAGEPKSNYAQRRALITLLAIVSLNVMNIVSHVAFGMHGPVLELLNEVTFVTNFVYLFSRFPGAIRWYFDRKAKS